MIVFILLPLLLAGSSCSLGQKDPENLKAVQEAEGSARKGWLGVTITDMTGAKAGELNTTTKRGALVTGVTDDSPAEKAGIREDDIITSFNRKAVENTDDLIEAVRTSLPGSKVTIVVMRKDRSTTLQATVGNLPRSRESLAHLLEPVSPVHLRLLRHAGEYGLDLMDLNPQLAEYFDTPGGHGVLVERVVKRSPAEKSGFKAGDVILTIGNESVEESGDIRAILNDYREGDSAAFGILRKGTRKTLTMAPEDHGWRGEMFRFRSIPESGPELHMEGLNFNRRHFEQQMEGLNFNRRHFEQQMEGLNFDRRHFEQQMDKLKVELKKIGREVQARMQEVRGALRREIREVTG
jgi:membrane-associated protease RseP (regulator of RpoE activity)